MRAVRSSGKIKRTSTAGHRADTAKSAAATNKMYAFVETLAAFMLGNSTKPPGQTLQLFLSKILKFTGAAGGAVYLVDSNSVQLIASQSYSEALARSLADTKLSASHLRRVVRAKMPLISRPGETKAFPATSINRIRTASLSFAHIPVTERKTTIAVVEIVGASFPEAKNHTQFLFSRIAKDVQYLIREVRTRLKDAITEREYESTIAGMYDGIVIVRDLKILYVNPALMRMFGYDSDAMILGKGIEVFIAPEDRERVLERSKSRIAGKKVPSRYEYKAIRKNGSIFDVEVVVSLISYKGEQASVAVHRDITLRHAIEKDLQQSEQMFRNVIDGILTVGDALVVTNLEGRVLQVNSEFERLTGIKKEEALGNEFPYQWLLDEEMSRYVLWIKELREKKSLRDFDIHWKNTEGRIISVSMNTTLLYNALHKPVAMMNMARDITERKDLEEENRLQFSRLRVLYELSRVLTSLLRVSDIAETMYRHILEILQFDAFFIDLYEESTGTVHNIICYDVIDGRRLRVPSESVETALESGTGIAKVIAAKRSLVENREEGATGMIEHPFGDKTRRSLSLLYIPMFSKDKTIGVLSIQSYSPNVYDESHMRILESFANLAAIALEKAKLYEETVSKSLQLQNRNKELDDFTYVVSHDLKEPLITVEGYSRILLKDHSQEKNGSTVEYVQSIIQSCTRMKGLIDDLLVLSRVSRLTELMENVSLNDVLNEVLEDLQFSIQEKHITILMPDLVLTYYCNPTHLKLVLRNLISNAIKFTMNDSPFIKITMEQNDKRILCSIQDNGIGIEKRFFDKIFVIFQRLHPEYEGSGAGLAIVKKIIELYQGQIWLESEIGKGTTFYFSLPR